MTSASRSRSASSLSTITPPSDDNRPPSKAAWMGLLATDDRPGKIGVALVMVSGDSGGDAHASASTPESYANFAAHRDTATRPINNVGSGDSIMPAAKRSDLPVQAP